MQVAVWDTYVKKETGAVMHFDILVPDTLKDVATIHGFGQEYLATKPYKTEALNTSICNFCHVEVAPPEVVAAIQKQGYYILPMAHCD